MNADRIELETKVAMLERTVDALSDELHQHAKTIAALQDQLRQVVGQLRPRQGDTEIEPHDTPPPHYGG